MVESTKNAPDVEAGSLNVFADLGFPDAGARKTKTRLAFELNAIIKERNLRQAEVAKLLGIPQSKVSAIVNYRLDGFSVEKLMDLLTLLNHDVEIVIRPSRGQEEGHVSVHALR